MGTALLTGLLLVATVMLAVTDQRRARRMERISAEFAVAAARGRELQRIMRQREQLAAAQALTEKTVDGTTVAVQQLHRGIASIPFGVLESIPATRDTTKIVREIHDFAADGAYGTIRGVNRLLGYGIRFGLTPRDGEQPTRGGNEPADDPQRPQRHRGRKG